MKVVKFNALFSFSFLHTHSFNFDGSKQIIFELRHNWALKTNMSKIVFILTNVLMSIVS